MNINAGALVENVMAQKAKELYRKVSETSDGIVQISGVPGGRVVVRIKKSDGTGKALSTSLESEGYMMIRADSHEDTNEAYQNMLRWANFRDRVAQCKSGDVTFLALEGEYIGEIYEGYWGWHVSDLGYDYEVTGDNLERAIDLFVWGIIIGNIKISKEEF